MTKRYKGSKCGTCGGVWRFRKNRKCVTCTMKARQTRVVKAKNPKKDNGWPKPITKNPEEYWRQSGVRYS